MFGKWLLNQDNPRRVCTHCHGIFWALELTIMKWFLAITLFAAILGIQAPAATAGVEDPYVDRPQPGETFPHFFTRVTRGALFQGIRLPKSPQSQKFLDSFYRWIWRPTWNGLLDHARRDIQKQGVDLWGNWYRIAAPLSVIAPTSAASAELGRAIAVAEAQDPDCAKLCREYSELREAQWASLNVHERQAFARAMVLGARIFGDRTLIEYLADEHGGSAESVMRITELKLLNTADFTAALRQMGWNGPIYFRGITGPSPLDPSRRWIVMNDDLLRQLTPFESPLLQSLEYVGIFAHELSHVFQDLAAAAIGIDLTVQSPEGALLLEGEAEYLAEQALARAARAQPFASALLLFVGEQGSEVVNRPGQAQQGNLFPYTVGLPLAASLFELTADHSSLRAEIIRTVAGQRTLLELIDGVSPR